MPIQSLMPMHLICRVLRVGWFLLFWKVLGRINRKSWSNICGKFIKDWALVIGTLKILTTLEICKIKKTDKNSTSIFWILFRNIEKKLIVCIYFFTAEIVSFVFPPIMIFYFFLPFVKCLLLPEWKYLQISGWRDLNFRTGKKSFFKLWNHKYVYLV